MLKSRFCAGHFVGWLVGCLLRPIDNEVFLETAPPFTVPCEGRKARF